MKNRYVKIISIFLCAFLFCGTMSSATFDGNTDATSVKNEKASVQTAAGESTASEKNETVYVIAGADGSVKKMIVSDHLKNSSDGKLNDVSVLTGIENVKGDELFSSDGSSIVWDAAGQDIYYQGSTDKELPVSVKVSYTLNGKKVSAADIAGKSGRVKIRFDYTNNESRTVKIDGKKKKIYVPFAMLTGLLLDNDVFTNIEVSNGKTISDGDRTAVIGLAFPGLNENLMLDTADFEVPSYVEITADAKKISLSSTVTVATNEVFNQIDISKLDKVDTLTGKIDELAKAMSKLTNGSSKLYDGVCTLLEKSGKLVDGINRLALGAEKLKFGSTELVDGATELADGAAGLSTGLNKLKSNNDKLTNASKAVFETLLKTADIQLAQAGITGIPALTIENYKTILNGIIASFGGKTGKANAENGASQLKLLIAQLDSYNEFYLGLAGYTAGVADASVGAAKLKIGSKKLLNGSKELDSGISKLLDGVIEMKNGTPALTSGIEELKDGSMRLRDGLAEFNEKGINKLVEAADGDIPNLVAAIKATVDVSLDYNSFSGISDETDGSVKFIYRTESIDG